MYLPKRDELLLRIVFALPNASSTGDASRSRVSIGTFGAPPPPAPPLPPPPPSRRPRSKPPPPPPTRALPVDASATCWSMRDDCCFANSVDIRCDPDTPPFMPGRPSAIARRRRRRALLLRKLRDRRAVLDHVLRRLRLPPWDDARIRMDWSTWAPSAAAASASASPSATPAHQRAVRAPARRCARGAAPPSPPPPPPTFTPSRSQSHCRRRRGRRRRRRWRRRACASGLQPSYNCSRYLDSWYSSGMKAYGLSEMSTSPAHV